MYATGIPSGMLVDARGPRWGVALGMVFFAAGYYPIAKGGRLFLDVQARQLTMPQHSTRALESIA